MEQTFGGWLRQQSGRDDPTGDVAKDWKADWSRCGKGLLTLEAMADHMHHSHRAPRSAMVALHCAAEEWRPGLHRPLIDRTTGDEYRWTGDASSGTAGYVHVDDDDDAWTPDDLARGNYGELGLIPVETLGAAELAELRQRYRARTSGSAEEDLEDQLRSMEIRKRDSDGPYFTAQEDSDYQRTLTVSLFKPEPAAVNIVIDVHGPDGHTAGGGINVSLEELQSILKFVEANRYGLEGPV